MFEKVNMCFFFCIFPQHQLVSVATGLVLIITSCRGVFFFGLLCGVSSILGQSGAPAWRSKALKQPGGGSRSDGCSSPAGPFVTGARSLASWGLTSSVKLTSTCKAGGANSRVKATNTPEPR